MDHERLDLEVDQNYDVFRAHLPALLQAHRGEHVLLRNGMMVAFFSDDSAALAAGRAAYSDGIYSVQEVTDRPVDLGFFSHAVTSGIA